jgi:hypothetical protein
MRATILFLVLGAVLGAQAPASRPKRPGLSLPAPRPPAGRLALTTKRWVDDAGVVKTEVRAAFSIFEYPAYKNALGDPREVLRRLLPASATALEHAPPRAFFDDEQGALVLERTEAGDVRPEADGRRAYVVEAGAQFVEIKGVAGRPAAKFTETGELFGMPYEGTQTVMLPQLVTGAAFDAERRTLSWSPVRIGGKPATAKFGVKLMPVERVLTGAYKAYGFDGPHFVARAVLHNDGPGRPTKIRLRHKVEGYSEWSPWTKIADLGPGETLVVPIHPVFTPAVAQLRSDTPAVLHAEWTYVDGDGAEKSDAEGAKLRLLGGNEFLFCRSSGGAVRTFEDDYDNASLLAAWVSRDEAIIREVAALGAKRAGGAAANEGIYPAIATLKGLYEVMVANDITYQHPPSLADTTLSFNNLSVQNVKYPRDVLRDRSGTCIDLAVLYASMLHATGLPAYLCIIPGHCFPVTRLPDGGLAAVEVTGVGGGGRLGVDAASFGDVFLYGMKELEKALQGPHVLIDLRHQWTHGVSCPELPPPGPDYVAKNPWREKIDPVRFGTLAEIREQAVRDLAGVHETALEDAAGNRSNASLRITPAVDARTFLVEMKTEGVLPTEDGKTVEVDVVQVFEGRSLLSALKGFGLRKTAKIRGSGQIVILKPDYLEVERWSGALEGFLELAAAEPNAAPVRLKVTMPRN